MEARLLSPYLGIWRPQLRDRVLSRFEESICLFSKVGDSQFADARFLSELYLTRFFLVVVPKTLLQDWRNELEKLIYNQHFSSIKTKLLYTSLALNKRKRCGGKAEAVNGF